MLNNLHIKNFRCFEDITFPSLGNVNLIVGKNNSGKSTLLEAISILASAANKSHIQQLREKRHDYQGELFDLFYHPSPNSQPADIIEIGDIEKKDYVTIMPKAQLEKKFPSSSSEIKQSTTPSHFKKYTNTFAAAHIKEGEKSYEITPCFYLDTSFIHVEDLAQMWDYAYQFMDYNLIKETLTIIEKSIIDLQFIPQPVGTAINKENMRLPMVRLENQKQAVPLHLLGEGILRLLQIILASFKAKDGFLLIDEFENGLHYSVQQAVWEKVFLLAKKLNIQVFVTTHSKDSLTTFADVAIADKSVDGKLITLGRSVAKSNRGKIITTVYDQDQLDWVVNSGMEVR